MNVFFALLPLIIFLIVRAKAKQAEEQASSARPQPPQETSEPTPSSARPVNPPVANPVREWVSSEGTASDEGECVEDDPQHCAVEHQEEPAYAAVFSAVLPRVDLARAVVMSEILGKPVSLRGDRFF